MKGLKSGINLKVDKEHKKFGKEDVVKELENNFDLNLERKRKHQQYIFYEKIPSLSILFSIIFSMNPSLSNFNPSLYPFFWSCFLSTCFLFAHK